MKKTPISDIFYNLFGYYNSEIKKYWDENYLINKEIKEIKFNDKFNTKLNKYLLQVISQCEVLTFGKYFNSTVNYLPNSIIKIKFGYSATNKIKLPNSIKFIDLTQTKLYYGIKKIPNSVVKIELFTIDNNFVKIIPNTVKILNIIHARLKINILPDDLEEFVIGFSYNYPIDNLPFKLKKINLPDDFNQSLDYLPESLEEIILGVDFNQPIDNLPRGLKKIILGRYKSNFNQSINNLPDNINCIQINNDKYSTSINKFPRELKNIKIYRRVYKETIEIKFKNNELKEIFFKLM